jgi:hypothetical protein
VIGPIAIPSAGTSAAGRFTFAGDEGLAKYEWPYIAIAGLVAGPTVLITAGIHAAEYTGIERRSASGARSPRRRCAGRS